MRVLPVDFSLTPDPSLKGRGGDEGKKREPRAALLINRERKR
jgi:hypothetical protein